MNQTLTRHRAWHTVLRVTIVALIGTLMGTVTANSRLAAQDAPRASAAMAAAVSRVRTLSNAGDMAAARVLLDSMVTNAEPASNDLAEALYWRAVLSERSGDAERDWKRLVIESPMAPQAPDALLKLGDIEILRGRPPAARAYLERLLRDFDDVQQRSKASLLIARSYFEERDTAHACTTIDDLRTRGVPEGELALQLSEMQRRCAIAAAAAAPTPDVKPVDAKTTDAKATDAKTTDTKNAEPKNSEAKSTEAAGSESANEKRASSKKSRTQYAVQIAAYDTRSQAEALVKRLKQRGWKARIDGERKPYRVRVGVFDTRAEAADMLVKLKKQGQKSAFVAELGK